MTTSETDDMLINCDDFTRLGYSRSARLMIDPEQGRIVVELRFDNPAAEPRWIVWRPNDLAEFKEGMEHARRNPAGVVIAAIGADLQRRREEALERASLPPIGPMARH